MKKLLYIDMDGVVADFDGGIKKFCPDLHTADYDNTADRVDEICEANPEIFHHLDPLPEAIESVKKLAQHYEIYFLSTPMWNAPLSFTGKRIWLEKHFGTLAERRLILTHRKDLNYGHYLIDDHIRHGVDLFKGRHIHFGSPDFPNWHTTVTYLINKA